MGGLDSKIANINNTHTSCGVRGRVKKKILHNKIERELHTKFILFFPKLPEEGLLSSVITYYLNRLKKGDGGTTSIYDRRASPPR